MKCSFDIPADLYKDELVCFIADRYNKTAMQILLAFLSQEGYAVDDTVDKPVSIHLEDNEMEILRGLINECHLFKNV